jgi:hypothetical protein
MTISSYRDLDAWQLGMSFVQMVYELASAFPTGERFGLTAQLRRAAASIPSQSQRDTSIPLGRIVTTS